jgi:hypothetical protein
MLQRLLLALVCTGLVTLISCEKKKSEGISPTYGATGNPHPGAQTVTGTSTPSNPATENTSIQVGGQGWSNPSCSSTLSLTLKGFSGNTEVTLAFATAIKSGTYAISTNPSGSSSCAMMIVNAPNQPNGIVWYGKTGSVSVLTTTSSINASFNNVVCTQQNFGFPTVTASGVLGCSGNQ